MIETTEKKKTRDIRFIKLDETKYWEPEFLASLGVKKVWGVYYYDASVAYHLCSLSRSYEFNFIESQTDAHLSDENYDKFREQDANSEAVRYYLKHDIDQIPVISEFELMGLGFEGSAQAQVPEWNTVTENQTDEEVMEEIAEYCRGNAV